MKVKCCVALVAPILAFFSGCCTTRVISSSAGQATEKYRLHEITFESISSATTSLSKPANTLNVLVLSGGGSFGAWGAGVLQGWRQNGRPHFQVVTGISTGALLSTYAYLENEKLDEPLKVAYTEKRNADIYTNGFLPTILFRDSLNDETPLYNLIVGYLSQDIIDDVAKTARDTGRKLYIGVANLDNAKFEIWDMVKIASDASNPNRYELFRKVVFASASIPIWVSPVEIDGHLYGDGGVRQQLFFPKAFIESAKEYFKAGSHNMHQLQFYIIINGQVGYTPAPDQPMNDCIIPIAKRTLETLLDAGEMGSLYRLQAFENEIGFGDINISRIPNTGPTGIMIGHTDSFTFDPDISLKLFNAGLDFGSGKVGTWETEVSLIDVDPLELH